MEASINRLNPHRPSFHEAPPTARVQPERPAEESQATALRRVLYHDFEEAKHYLRYFQDGDPIALSDALVRREGAPLFVIARERAMAALRILSEVPAGPQRIEFSFDRTQQHLWAAYSGDLVSDILLYRTFREVQLRQGGLDDDADTLLAALDLKLQQPTRPGVGGHSERRLAYRFPCDFLAGLRVDGLDVPVDVHDISAGGVRVSGCEVLEPGSRADLVLHAQGRGDKRVAVLNARVAWSLDDYTGIMFLGGPRWSTF